MSDQFRSFVSANHGSVHSGSGNVINNIFTQLAESVGKEPRGIADDQLAWLRQRFLQPEGFARARAILEASGTVFLDGEQGAGRKATAWMLLAELYSGAETFHEILPKEKGPPYLDTGQVSEGALLLVDLSVITEEQLWTTVHDELSNFRKVVRNSAARLVVVLPSRRIKPLQADLGAHRVGITRPSAGAAFQRYLRAEDIPVAETDSMPEDLSKFLAKNPPMRRVADFAALVIEARSRAGSEGGFAAWCADALGVWKTNRANLSPKSSPRYSRGRNEHCCWPRPCCTKLTPTSSTKPQPHC